MITAENYFSYENEMKYFGSSQFKSFRECEAKALAKIEGEYVEEPSTALLIGSYVDAHFEGTLDLFCAQHPEIMKRDGSLKAEFEHANTIIGRVERDDMWMAYMSGEKQVIKTGEWLGVPWKIKIDSYHPGSLIVDLKVMRDFGDVWLNGQGKSPFVEAWGYDFQAAIYQAVEGNRLPFVIAGATKEKPEPDHDLFSIPQDAIETATEIIAQHIERFADIKAGRTPPTRCGRCDYCRRTKKLTKVTDYREIGA
jgi:hypothetical protein